MSSIQLFLNNGSKNSKSLLKLLRDYNNFNITLLPTLFNTDGNYKKYFNIDDDNLYKMRLHQLKTAHCALFLKEPNYNSNDLFELGYIKGKYPFLPIFSIINKKYNNLHILNNLDDVSFNKYNNNINEVKYNLYKFLDVVGNNNNISNKILNLKKEKDNIDIISKNTMEIVENKESPFLL